jgi:hypothetical protein
MGDFTYASKCTLLPRGRRHRGIVGGHLFVEGIAVHGVELVLEGIMKIRSFGSDLPKEDRWGEATPRTTPRMHRQRSRPSLVRGPPQRLPLRRRARRGRGDPLAGTSSKL